MFERIDEFYIEVNQIFENFSEKRGRGQLFSDVRLEGGLRNSDIC